MGLSCSLILLTVFSVIGGFLFGYDTGIMSGAAVFVQEDLGVSDLELDFVVSFTVGGAAIGSAMSGHPMQWYGRRPLIMLASAFYVIGGVLVGVATDLTVLLIGRTLLGLGIGISSITVPVYIAEVAPNERRGQLVALNNLFIVLGQFIACGVNVACQAFLTKGLRWRVSMGLAAVPAAVQLIGFLGLPESPRWLAQMGKTQEAADIIKKLRGQSASPVQIQEDLSSLENLQGSDVGDVRLLDIYRDPVLRRIFALGMGIMALQQLSGINTMMYYGSEILIMVGLPKSLSIELSALLALAQIIGICVSIRLFDKLGRRALMLPSTLAAAFFLVVIGVSFMDINRLKWVALVGVFGYLIAFGCGLSSGPWIVNAEIYPLHVRGVGNAAATTMNWFFNFVISISFLSLCNFFGKGPTFLMIALVAVLGFFWLNRCLPETKGLALEEVRALFERAAQTGTAPTSTNTGYSPVTNPAVGDAGSDIPNEADAKPAGLV